MKTWHKSFYTLHLKGGHSVPLMLFLCTSTALFISLGPCQKTSSAPEQCPLCTAVRYHAPCLINLSTGQIGELTVYDPHPYLEGEIAEVQQTGTFFFLPCIGTMGWRDTSAHACHLALPTEYKPMNPKLFCQNCQSLLSSFSYDGYALLDLYHLNKIQIYPIFDGANYTIRCYAVSISANNNSPNFLIDVTGLTSDPSP